MGSRIYTRKNKTGKIVYYGYFYFNGKRIRRMLATTKKAAERRFKEIEYEFLVGNEPQFSIKPISDAFEEFCQSLKRHDTSSHRYKVLRRSVERFVDYTEGCNLTMLNHIQVKHAKNFIEVRSQKEVKNKYLKAEDDFTPKLSIKTLNNDIQTLRRFFQYCQDQGWVNKNPFLSISYQNKSSNGERYYFTTKDLTQIFNNAGKFADFYSLMLYTGLRPTDAYNITQEQIEGGVLNLKMQKTQEYLVNIPVPEQLKEILADRIDQSDGLLFPDLTSDRQRRYARKRVQAQFKKEQVREHNINLHTFRHTYAHKLLDSGVPKEVVQTLLGHSSITTTEIYANWMNQEKLGKYVEGLEF